MSTQTETFDPKLDQPTLRVLIVEDSPRDVKLLVAMLERAGFSLTYDSVDTPELLQNKLELLGYDVIISDYNLPGWTAMDALEILKKSGKDIPFIVVSGSLGDEAAADCIKHGATDFILKDRMARLPSAIQRALLEKQLRDKRKEAEEELRNSERQYRLLFEDNPHPMWVFDLETLRFIRVNDAAIDCYGYSRDEFLAMTIKEIRPPEDIPKLLENIAQAHESLEARGTWKHRKKDGQTIDVEITSRPIIFGGRRAELVLAHDVTERKRAERENLRLKAAIEQAAEAVMITDPAGIIQYVNPAFTWTTGYASEEALNQGSNLLKSGVHGIEVYQDLWKTIQSGKIWQGEMVNRRKDGTLYPEWMTVSPVLNSAGEVVNYIAIMEDYTERKRAAESLRASEVRYRRLFEAAKDGILILDARTGEIIDVNPFLVDLLGYSREECLGKRLWEIGPFKDQRNSQESFRILQENEYIRYDDLPLQARSGMRVDVEFVSNAYSSGEMKVIQCNIRDVTERNRATARLLQSEEQFRLISENVTDLIAVVDLDGKRVYNSPSYRGILGNPDALRGTVSFNEIHPDDREHIKEIFQQTIRTGKGQRAEYRFLLKDKTTRLIESQGSLIRNQQGEPVSVVIVSRDITERKSLEEQLRQAQKMEAVGQLAGGVAHDFNNLLTVINGYSEVMLEQLKPENPHQKYVKEIMNAGERAAALTRQLLAFSRQQVLTPRVLDLNRVIADVHTMLKRLIGEDIDLIATPGKDLGRVKADPGQMEQILLNLAVNARDAMPRGGKLTIETSNVELDESYAASHVAVKPGAHVMLAVSDTGIGMDAATQKRIFEPFFTTKELGKGTGLGLSTVYGIVKQSEGSIWVYSEPGHGTTFKVYLPRVDKPIEIVVPVKPKAKRLRGSETILLAEDEPSVRSLVRTTLASHGYQVLEATNGAEALLTSQQHQGKVHLLLTDLVMPGINGRALAGQMATLRPEMKVLYMSGYADDAVIRNGGLEAGMAFLQKPFTPEALARKVREVLDAA